MTLSVGQTYRWPSLGYSEPVAVKTWLGRAIATAGGAGYSPIAPGTCGTAVTVPVAYVLAGTEMWLFGLITVAVIAIGIWAADVADKSWGTHDSGRIVIDEVAGYLLTVIAVDRGDWLTLLCGFVLFRALDIIKPPPVRLIDQRLGGGWGVVLDDVAAGAMACGLMVAARYYGLLP